MRVAVMRAVVTSLGAFLVAATLGPAARAADETPEPITWAVSPSDEFGPDGRAWAELEIEPGQAVTQYAAVRNLSAIDATFQLTAADGYYTAKGRFNMLAADQPSRDAGTWIALEPDVLVHAGETVVVPYTVTVPVNAIPGDHPAGVAASVMSAQVSADDATAQVGVVSRVGFRVIVRVKGELTPSLTAQVVDAHYQSTWNPLKPGKLTFTYQAENTGNTELSFSDSIAGAEPVERGSLYPGESREVVITGVPAWPWFSARAELQITPAAQNSDPVAAPVTLSASAGAWPLPQLVAAGGLALVVWAVAAGRRKVNKMVDAALERGRREALTDSDKADE